MVITSELKVNYLFNRAANIICHPINKCRKILLFNVKHISLFIQLNTFTHKLINNCGTHDQFEVCLLIHLKLIIGATIQVDAKTWDVDDSVLRIP